MKTILGSIVVFCLALLFVSPAGSEQYVQAKMKFYSLPGDGYIDVRGNDWNALHSATSGRVLYDQFYSYGALARIWEEFGYSLFRGFFPFDTSSLPAGCNITAATLKLHTQPESDAIRNGFPEERMTYFILTESYQESPNKLEISDFSKIGDLEGSIRVPITDIQLGQYNAFPLNSTGLSWINPDGNTFLCMVTNWDLDNISPVDEGGTGSGFSIFVSEKDPDQQYDPCLEVIFNCPEEDVPAGAEILGYVEEPIADKPTVKDGCSIQTTIYDSSYEEEVSEEFREHYLLGTTDMGQPVVCVHSQTNNWEIEFLSGDYRPISVNITSTQQYGKVVSVMAENKVTGNYKSETRNITTGELISEEIL